MGLEWRDPDGTSFLTILHHFVSYDQYGGYWGITYSVLEASESAFEQAKTHATENKSAAFFSLDTGPSFWFNKVKGRKEPIPKSKPLSREQVASYFCSDQNR